MSDKFIKALNKRDCLLIEADKAKKRLPEWKKYRRAVSRVESLKQECSHPDSYTEPYSWHHGYGKYIEGLHCKLCGKYKAWKTMGEWENERPYIVFED